MKPTASTTEHVEQALDDALALTFPASDPVAVSVPSAPPSLAFAAPAAWRAQHELEKEPLSVA